MNLTEPVLLPSQVFPDVDSSLPSRRELRPMIKLKPPKKSSSAGVASPALGPPSGAKATLKNAIKVAQQKQMKKAAHRQPIPSLPAGIRPVGGEGKSKAGLQGRRGKRKQVARKGVGSEAGS